MSNDLITFIIPTINRSTLIYTLYSLKIQNNPNWKAIIIFDNVTPGEHVKYYLESDHRFKYIVLPKKMGQGRNSAGLVRNIGMEQCDTEWIGFVDDDDTIISNYVEKLQEEIIINSDIECVIFRMLLNNVILPPPEAINFEINKVGISFCYKLKLFNENLKFTPSSTEDFFLLDKIRTNDKKILISRYVTYLVHSIIPIENNEQNNSRVIINGD